MKIGIIGAGGISALHAQGYRSLGVDIAAVAEPNEQVFASRKELFGNAKHYPSHREMLADPSIEIADICVGTRLHFDIIRDAAAAGKHIFTEKTMTDSVENSTTLLSQLRDYKPNFQVGYMKRFFPATARFMELLPAAGDVVSAYIRSYQGFERSGPADVYDSDWLKPKDGKPSWGRTYACGGMLNMAGSHMLDLMNLMLGEPANVYSLNWQPPAYDSETNSHALFRMKSGSVVHFEAAASPYSRNGRYRDGWDESIEIDGKLGQLRIIYPCWDRPLHNAPIVQFYSEADKAQTEYTFPKVDAFKEQFAYFLKNCAEGTRSSPGVYDGYYVDRMIAACYQSNDTGLPISF